MKWQWGEMPCPFPDMKLWGAVIGNWAFIIVSEGEGTHFTASYRNQITKEPSGPFASRLGGYPGHQPTFKQAEALCKAKYKELLS